MEVGESRVTNSILRMIGKDTMVDVENYVADACSKDYLVITSLEQMSNVFSNSLEEFITCLSQDELLDLRSYTGYNFKHINAILRRKWTYDNNGLLTPEVREKFSKLANSIGNILGKFKMPDINFISFRGTTLHSFSDYGISELSQLNSLKGKFLYDSGFTSTSVIEDTCYFNKELDTGKNYNVEVRYLISSDSQDGALLVDNDTTYSASQNEFLLSNGSLSKVIDVKVDEVSNTAVLTVVLIPKKIYDLGYVNNRNNSRNI